MKLATLATLATKCAEKPNDINAVAKVAMLPVFLNGPLSKNALTCGRLTDDTSTEILHGVLCLSGNTGNTGNTCRDTLHLQGFLVLPLKWSLEPQSGNTGNIARRGRS